MSGNKKQNEQLLNWLNSLPSKTQVMLAEKMQTTTGQLRQIAYGNRPCSARLAIELDKNSGGTVSMIDLAPTLDWDHVRLFVHLR